MRIEEFTVLSMKLQLSGTQSEFKNQHDTRH